MIDFNQHIKTAAKYINNYRLNKVINMLDLKPLNWIDYDIKKKIKNNLQPIWIDEFGCELSLYNKIVSLSFNKIDNKRIYTDEYANLDIKSIVKISETLLLSFKDEYLYLSYHGLDNKLRTFYIDEEECIRCSSLFQGMENLYNFVDYYKIKSHEKISDGWVIGLPIQDEFYLEINKNYMVVDLLKEIHNGR